MRCQHESIDSIVKTKRSGNQTICGDAQIREFCSQLLFNRQQNFRLRSHDK